MTLVLWHVQVGKWVPFRRVSFVCVFVVPGELPKRDIHSHVTRESSIWGKTKSERACFSVRQPGLCSLQGPIFTFGATVG